MRDVIYHTPLHVKKAKIGVSGRGAGVDISRNKVFLISLASPRFSKGKDLPSSGTENFFAKSIVTQNTPRLDAIDEGNDCLETVKT
jgi:hypothetical protein